MTTINYGKYKGYNLKDVPEDYLEWMIENQKKSIEMYERELERRRSMAEANLSIAEKIVIEGYRAMAKKNHPDVGGNTETMKEINLAKEALIERVKLGL